MSLPNEFTSEWYDKLYFADVKGKSFRNVNGKPECWGYRNENGEWHGAKQIAEAWSMIFKPRNMLDVGCGRGTFIAYARDMGIEAEGFDYSEWAIENRYPRCKAKWIRRHDATTRWPYPDRSFDLVVALDCLEHIYEENLNFVISELFRVAKKYIFLQIAVTGTGDLQGEQSYMLKKGEKIPLEVEGNAVAGHVTLQPESFWNDRLNHPDWIPRRDLREWFVGLVDPAVIKNWLANSIIVLSTGED
jgi:ubiquinone/menaquinone biosynthesis C-methylase UbiE